MIPIIKEVRVIRKLLSSLNLSLYILPILVILGIFSSLSESIGFSLFIPFLQSLDKTDISVGSNNQFIQLINHLLVGVPAARQTSLIGLCIITAIFLKIGLSYVYRMLCVWLGLHTKEKLQRQLYQQLMYVSQSYWDTHQRGELLNIITGAVEETNVATKSLVWLIIHLCTIVFLSGLLLLISWQLTVMVAFALVAVTIFIQHLTRKAKTIGSQHLKYQNRLGHLLIEGLTGSKTIKAFGQEETEIQRFEQGLSQVYRSSLAMERESAILDTLSEGLAVAILAITLLIALKAQLSIPVVLTFILIFYRLQPQVKLLDSHRLSILMRISSVEKVVAVLNDTSKFIIPSGTVPFSQLAKSISFESVTFYYPGQKAPALSDIFLCIPKGKVTALVGLSGAGKSTLINLLCRFYEVSEGNIYVDDYPLSSLSLLDWRKKVALVSQDIHIFSSTIRHNIAYGHRDATEAEIIAAAKYANAHDFICNLPQRYDTLVGDQGIRLSGGQKQRISIARALLCNPEILVLDEATNALDSLSEHLIQTALDKLSYNRTVIAIAHRLSTIEHANQIVVMDQGKIIEQGNFTQLMSQSGIFSQLHRMQYRGI